MPKELGPSRPPLAGRARSRKFSPHVVPVDACLKEVRRLRFEPFAVPIEDDRADDGEWLNGSPEEELARVLGCRSHV